MATETEALRGEIEWLKAQIPTLSSSLAQLQQQHAQLSAAPPPQQHAPPPIQSAPAGGAAPNEGVASGPAGGPHAAAWTEQVHPENGATYYWNSVTGESTYTKPEASRGSLIHWPTPHRSPPPRRGRGSGRAAAAAAMRRR